MKGGKGCPTAMEGGGEVQLLCNSTLQSTSDSRRGSNCSAVPPFSQLLILGGV